MFVDLGYIKPHHVARFAAEAGNVAALEWARDRRYNIANCRVVEYGASKGHIGVLHWADYRGYDLTGVIKLSASAGHLHVLEWLEEVIPYQDEIPTMVKILLLASTTGQMKVVKWALEKIPDWNQEFGDSSNDICNLITSMGDLSLLQLALSKGWPWQPNSAQLIPNSLEILQYAWSLGYTPTSNAISYAIGIGNLQMVQWLGDHGIKFDISDTYLASIRHQVHVLEWLVSGGCPIHPLVFELAAQKGDVRLLDLLWNYNKKKLPSDDLWLAAIRSGNVRVLDWLEECENKFPCDFMGRLFDCAIECGSIPILQWLVKRGAIIDLSMYPLYQRNDVAVLKWLYDQQPQLFTSDKMRQICNNAVSWGALDIVIGCYQSALPPGIDLISMPFADTIISTNGRYEAVVVVQNEQKRNITILSANQPSI